MIPVSTFQGKRVGLFGLGGSGLTTARALLEGGAEVIADDDNPDRREAAQQAGVPVGALRDADWSGLAALVLAPGVPLTHPEPHWSVRLAQANGVETIGDIELFCRERAARSPDATLIAITGTNGKSTTTALIGHVLGTAGRDPQVGGNIGRAALDLAAPAPGSTHVIECSSYQIDLAPGLNPTIGLLLNITPDHLDRHGTMENYAAIKERLVAASDLAVVGVDDGYCASVADRLERAGHKVVRISAEMPLSKGVQFDPPVLTELTDGARTVVADLSGVGSLRGRHNGQNAAAAFVACRAAGLSVAQIVAGLKSFPGLAHRMEEIGKIGHVLFVNDSKATNAEAAERALLSFDRIYWLAGGRMKDGGITALVPYAERIAGAYLFGEAKETFRQTLDGYCPTAVFDGMDGALAAAHADASADPAREAVVLLSPACASFDQFASFEARGDAFREAFAELRNAKDNGSGPA